MPRIVIGDGALYYERQGVGFPVLFISGLSGFASFWQDQVAAFARKFDVVTHDHRGIGQSDVTRSGFTVDRMAADVVGLMDALEIEKAVAGAWPWAPCAFDFVEMLEPVFFRNKGAYLVGRVVRGKRKKRWLADVLKHAGEKADYIEAFD